MAAYSDVEQYLADLPEATRAVVDRLRESIHAAVPGLEETIRYDMPTFTLEGRSVLHLAGWQNHVSVYPVPDDPALAAEVAPYVAGRGTLRFQLRDEVPYDLVGRVAASLAARR